MPSFSGVKIEWFAMNWILFCLNIPQMLEFTFIMKQSERLVRKSINNGYLNSKNESSRKRLNGPHIGILQPAENRRTWPETHSSSGFITTDNRQRCLWFT